MSLDREKGLVKGSLQAFVMHALEKLVITSELLRSIIVNVTCSYFLRALRGFVMHSLDKNSRARTNYSEALL